MPFAGGVSPPFLVFSLLFQRVIHRIVAPTTCGFNYLIFNYMSVVVFDRRFGAESWCLTVAESWCLSVENSPESQRSVDNPKNGPQKRSKPLCGGW